MGAIGIKDVAKLAGVSTATVSRVLSGTDAVAENTRQKVLAAAEQLGYQPNLLGRHLRCRQTNIILIMLSSLANTFCSKVIRGIEQEAGKNGYHILICATDGVKEKEDTYLNLVRNKLADGAIILNSSLSKEQMQELSGQFPVVQCSEYIDTEHTPFVSIDNRAAAYDAVSYLLAHGRKKIVFFGVSNDLISSKLRFEGYLAALSDHGIPFDKELVVYGNYGFRNATRVIPQFLRQRHPFDGIFALSDQMAAGAISVLKKSQICVPRDVSVIGFDNTEITTIMEPTITTVAQPQKLMGETAFRMLRSLLKKEKPENVILKHQLELRESTRYFPEETNAVNTK